jgi:carboxymethylenebutenolidase
VAHEQLTLRTRDGDCPAHVFTPQGAGNGAGPWPAVIFYMDGLAIRPALFEMGQRMADLGYVVLLPDMFYRAGPYAPLVPAEVFATGDVRKALGHLFSSTDNARAGQDTEAFLAYLDTRADVAGRKVGATGYCMGGGMALTAAGTWPERIAAAASFHAGGLVTEQPTSPHLLAPRMKGRIYVAGADNDNSYPPEMAEQLEKALTEAGVDHRCEIYAGALHGWTMPDFPIFNPEAAERHWTELAALFKATLH